MSETTKIQWADATFNPWIGCTKVSPGCANCYAENTTRARVLRGQGHETWGKGKARSRTSAANWKGPVRWNLCSPHWERMRVFPSLCDWLDDEVPIEWLADFLKLIHDTPNLDWLLLTKRPENFARLAAAMYRDKVEDHFYNWASRWIHRIAIPENVWIGVSVEDQKRADERIPQLLAIPARVRFLSVEPLLGPVNLRLEDAWVQLAHVPSWIIVGGESGHKARPCDVTWIQDIVRQCKGAGVPAFVKQLGENCITENANMQDWPDTVVFSRHGTAFAGAHPQFAHKKGGNPSEWPEDLRVRQFPNSKPIEAATP